MGRSHLSPWAAHTACPSIRIRCATDPLTKVEANTAQFLTALKDRSDYDIAIGFSAKLLAQAPGYDLLLKGGHVIDPANHIDEVRDVAVFQGKIAAVERSIPPEQARKVVDVSKLYVTPGLIDIHYHVGHGGAPMLTCSASWRIPGRVLCARMGKVDLPNTFIELRGESVLPSARSNIAHSSGTATWSRRN
jgi:hypothetical protein